VPPSNGERLAAAIDELLLDPERRAMLGAAALERARRHYGAAAVLGSLEALYDRLLNRVGAAPPADELPIPHALGVPR
jgi:glycosyltransferase involved in cell wall biosynthesis